MWRHKHVQKIRTQRNVSYPKQNGLEGGGGEDRFSFEFTIFIAHKHVKK